MPNQPATNQSRRNLWIAAAVLLLSGSLAGCSRPGDENINKLLVVANDSYEDFARALQELST